MIKVVRKNGAEVARLTEVGGGDIIIVMPLELERTMRILNGQRMINLWDLLPMWKGLR